MLICSMTVYKAFTCVVCGIQTKNKPFETHNFIVLSTVVDLFFKENLFILTNFTG